MKLPFTAHKQMNNLLYDPPLDFMTKIFSPSLMKVAGFFLRQLFELVYLLKTTLNATADNWC